MASDPILRAYPENGPVRDDPSVDVLFQLLQDIEAGQGTFLIVVKTIDPSGQTYAQTLRNEDGSYVVEHREGNAESHDSTIVSDLRAAHALLTGWAFERPDWDNGISWSPIVL
jgi:hypothetical protein